ncbi:hypothetical protein AYO45_04940 [Gammaproteobacteria bacterium SCGC AG-212-F23]|nr:hypothetical protein AYO45_04940 [Gammaproteobacteria bacterium SCGC AG-212-F23]
MMQVKITTLSQLAAHFGRDIFCLQQMLQHWIQKGKIRRCQKTGACEKCQQCAIAEREIYEWVGV